MQCYPAKMPASAMRKYVIGELKEIAGLWNIVPMSISRYVSYRRFP